jgi:hypothetical protein
VSESKRAVEDSLVVSEQWGPKRVIVAPFREDCIELAVNVKTLMTNVKRTSGGSHFLTYFRAVRFVSVRLDAGRRCGRCVHV